MFRFAIGMIITTMVDPTIDLTAEISQPRLLANLALYMTLLDGFGTILG